MTGFFIFGGILVVLLATVVWAAIRGGEDTGVALGAAERRDAAIEALRDLELEYRTGKLTAAEYGSVRARLERAAIEARDAAASGAGRPAASASADGIGGEAFCTACGAPLAGGEAFCAACGASLGVRR